MHRIKTVDNAVRPASVNAIDLLLCDYVTAALISEEHIRCIFCECTRTILHKNQSIASINILHYLLKLLKVFYKISKLCTYSKDAHYKFF